MQIEYPFQISDHGRVATTDYAEHVYQMIEQLLFTSPGERVNMPTFGCAIQQLVFASNSPELATATQALIQGALQQWLGDIIKPESVQVKNDDTTLQILIQYVILRTQSRQVSTFQREVSP
jgi:phage baseplate assembly protein W